MSQTEEMSARTLLKMLYFSIKNTKMKFYTHFAWFAHKVSFQCEGQYKEGLMHSNFCSLVFVLLPLIHALVDHYVEVRASKKRNGAINSK